ncbi:MBL fold metallo-hydrolase [Salinibaculum marinum]|uniref:MBL fold metallo-hydrolase n=1 Tax=Salinibaculum marinum TaxID=3131993 RepID=UPI0030D558EC
MKLPRTLAVVCLTATVVVSGCAGLASNTTESPATATATAADTLEVHVVNVGQSESLLVVGPTETMLVDTGNFATDGRYVRQYLRERGIDRIDHLVVSHADADHIGGTAAIIESFETEGKGVGAIYDPGIAASTRTYERYLDAVEAHDVPLYETRAGDLIDFADADVDVFGPPEPYVAGRDRNENSIVLELVHGQAEFLFTGDAGRQREADLVETYGDVLRTTVLKTGHHGSASSSSGVFLDAVAPAAATVSSSYESPYGHPAAAVLDRLAARAIPTYWTATHGTVRFTSDGQRITVATQQTAPTDPARLREADPVVPGSTAPLQPVAVIFAANGTVRETAEVGTVAADGGPTPPDEPLALVTVHADAAGDDRTNLDDEYLVFENRGTAPLDLSGWTVSDAAGSVYTVPDGVTLDPGERVRLSTGDGTDTATALYWDAGRPVWNNDGDTVTVTEDTGTPVLTEVYG